MPVRDRVEHAPAGLDLQPRVLRVPPLCDDDPAPMREDRHSREAGGGADPVGDVAKREHDQIGPKRPLIANLADLKVLRGARRRARGRRRRHAGHGHHGGRQSDCRGGRQRETPAAEYPAVGRRGPTAAPPRAAHFPILANLQSSVPAIGTRAVYMVAAELSWDGKHSLAGVGSV